MFRRCLAPSVALILALSPAALAQDDCATATPAALGQSLPFDTAGMTATPIQWSPWCGSVFRQDVWFSFQAPTTGTYLASACGPQDCALELFTGSCASPVRINCDRDRCRHEDFFARGGKVYFRASAGETILARVGPTTVNVGDSAGTFRVTSYAAPAFDDCSTPMVIQEGSSVYVEPFTATMDGPLPTCGSPYGSDMWFEFVPTTSGVFEASTCSMLGGVAGSTSISLYTGACGALMELGCRSRNCSGGTETVYSFTGTAGTRYLLRLVGTFSLLEGDFTLDRVGGNPADECVTAPDAPGKGVFHTISLSGSTVSPEPWTCGGFVNGDVWHRFVAQESALHNIYTLPSGSSFSTLMAIEVREGPCGSGVLLGCDTGTSPQDVAQVTTYVTAGTELFIRVGADATQSLDALLRIVPGPVNDRCVDATPIVEEVWSAFQTREATRTSDWMCGTNFGGDIWFTVRPNHSGPYEIVVCETHDQTDKLEVYEGTCGNWQFLGCSSDDQACFNDPLAFTAIAGNDYLIRVKDPNYDAAAEILVSRGNPPIHDECTGALPLTPGELPWSLAYSTYSTGVATDCGPQGNQDVWFYYDAIREGRVAVSLCGRNATVAGVYGGPCSSLTRIQCTAYDMHDVCAPGPYGPSFTFSTVPGQRYYIRINGIADQRDVLTLVEEAAGQVGTPFCSPNPNSTGQTSDLSAYGSPELDVFSLDLELTSLPAGVTCMTIVSRDQGFTPNPAGSAGNLCLAGFIGRYNRLGEAFAADTQGEGSFAINRTASLSIPGNFAPPMAGDTWHFQVWHRDVVSGAASSNFTNGLTILFR